MQSIGTVKSSPKPPIDDDPDASTTTPNSGTTTNDGPCFSTEFDPLDDILKQCGGGAMPKSSDLPSNLRDKLEVRVTPSTPQIQTGGRVDITIILRNKSNEPLPLYFSGDPTPRFEVEAVDKKGKRVDLPSGKQPPWPKGTQPAAREVRATKITLDRGGTARVKITWDAFRPKWAPEKARVWDGSGFPRVPDKPLPPGKYTLRVVVPLVGVFEKNEIELPKVPIEIVS